VAITEDDANVITAAEDLTIKVFDFKTKECHFTFNDAQECKTSFVSLRIIFWLRSRMFNCSDGRL